MRRASIGSRVLNGWRIWIGLKIDCKDDAPADVAVVLVVLRHHEIAYLLWQVPGARDLQSIGSWSFDSTRVATGADGDPVVAEVLAIAPVERDHRTVTQRRSCTRIADSDGESDARSQLTRSS